MVEIALGVVDTRREMICTRAGDNQCVVAYAALVGANDNLVFDGGGYVAQNGRLVHSAPRFVEGVSAVTVDLDRTTRLRREYTPRHVPDKFIQVPMIPTTLTGKKLEVPVRRLLMGVPLDKAANTSAMADPSALDAFIDYAQTQDDYKM